MKFKKMLINVGLAGTAIAFLAYVSRRLSIDMTQDEVENAKQFMDTFNKTGKFLINDEEAKQAGDITTELAKMGLSFLGVKKEH